MDVDFSASDSMPVDGGPTANNASDNSLQPQMQPGSLLGIVVPGGPVRTDFAPVDSTGMKLVLQMKSPGDLPVPLSSVSDMVCFLLPNAPLPSNHGLLIYWQVTVETAPQPGGMESTPTTSGGASSGGRSSAEPRQTGFELLGAITPSRPSGVFRTNWSQHEQLINLLESAGISSSSATEMASPPLSSSSSPSQSSTATPSSTVTFGVSIEPLDLVQNLNVQNWGVESRLFVAQKIATDLFHYMQSFDTGAASASNQLIVPSNIFERWMERFESRFRRDPNFFMKTQD